MTDPTPKPGEEHRLFEKDVGTWDAEVTVTPAPGAAPQVSKGVSTSRLVGGRWLVTDYEAESGFAGHGVYGFDPSKRRYVGTWVDTARTFLVVYEGDWDPAAKALTFRCEARLPDGRELRWREVTTWLGPDEQRFRSLFPGPGGDHELMAVIYRRRK